MAKQNDSSQIKDLLSQDVKTQKAKNCKTSSSCDGTDWRMSSSPFHHSASRFNSGQAMGGKDELKMCSSTPLFELKRLPSCHVELERLSYGRTHTILVNVDEFHQGKLVSQNGQPKWNSCFVKMPNSDENVIQTGIRRWDRIHKYLSTLSRKRSSSDVENAIKKYNARYKDQWSFDALHSFFKSLPAEEKETTSSTLYKIADLALRLPHICKKAIPLLKKGQSHTITLSQIQIACLLANAFYCTFPHRNTSHHNAEYANYPTINFSSLFGDCSQRKKEKLKAIFNYFRTVTDHERKPNGLVTFERCCLHDPPQWRSQSARLTKLHVSSEGTIEENGQGMLLVDFACNLVGGGVLGNGLVQEEILFLTHPELIVARLFTERLADNECLKIIGSQQYSVYTGFSDTFECLGSYTDRSLRDEWLRRHRKIVAIDALNFRNPREQYSVRNVIRELNKAYCGFKREEDIPPDYLPAVATGNWGCGAFKGDPKLKALLQLMAAAVAERDVAYFTFHNSHLEMELLRMHHFLSSHNVTVGWLKQNPGVDLYFLDLNLPTLHMNLSRQLFEVLEHYCRLMCSNRELDDLYKYIRNTITDMTCKHQDAA